MTRLRPDYRQGVRNRNDILLLSVVYSLSYEGEIFTLLCTARAENLKKPFLT